MTCRELIEFLDDYVEGGLPPAQRVVFDEHLSICQHCREYLKTYRDTIELARAACEQGEALPPDVPEDLVRAVLAARKLRVGAAPSPTNHGGLPTRNGGHGVPRPAAHDVRRNGPAQRKSQSINNLRTAPRAANPSGTPLASPCSDKETDAVLRITRLDGEAPGQMLRVAGSLSGPGIAALLEACGPRAERALVLDLSEVTFVDAQGLDCLLSLRRSGVVLAGCTPYMTELLRETPLAGGAR